MTTGRGDERWARLCSRLDAEWRQIARSKEGRAAVQRWVGEEPALAGACSAEDVLALCQRRGDAGAGHGETNGSQAALGAVLRAAANDDFAQRTVMQAILPGLLALRRRASYMVASPGSRWDGEDELEQEIVTLAYERVRALAGTTQAWAAETLVNQTWSRLRVLNKNERRWRARNVGMCPEWAEDLPDSGEHSAAEQLAHLVVDAVQDGTLALEPAGLLYTYGVVGNPLVWAAEELSYSRRSVSRSLARSARILAAAS
jgi:hypothetical protein